MLKILVQRRVVSGLGGQRLKPSSERKIKIDRMFLNEMLEP